MFYGIYKLFLFSSPSNSAIAVFETNYHDTSAVLIYINSSIILSFRSFK